MPEHPTRFQNLDVIADRRGSFADIWRFRQSARQQAAADRLLPPPTPTPVVANDGAALRDNATRLSITWVGHSSFLIQMGGRSILTDPVWSKTAGIGALGPRRMVAPGVRLADLPPIDLVLISHSHYDHLDSPTIRWLGNRPTYLVPSRLGAWFHARGCTKVHECAWWDSLDALGLHFVFLPAQHWSRRTPWD